MSHYHLEMILPPVADVEKSVAQILKPFDESEEDEDGYSKYAFWDWYVIGGRWSADHVLSAISEKRMEAFQADVPKYTVSGVMTAGGYYEKPAGPDNPPDIVDRLVKVWKQHFPEFADLCPFWGLTDQYNKQGHVADICRVDQLSDAQSCARLMIVTTFEGELRLEKMLQTDFWNGVSWCESGWDGSVLQVIKAHNEDIRQRRDRIKDAPERALDWWQKYGQHMIVRDDYLAVTIDYHT